MKKFAFLTHPVNERQLTEFWPLAKILPGFAKKLYFKSIPPIKVFEINNIRSIQGQDIGGYLFSLPLISNQVEELSQPLILEKINAAARLAEKLGAGILGLGGLFSVKTYPPVKRNYFPVSNGNFYTAWTAVEAVHRVAKVKDIDLENSTVTVIGASGAIGPLCARELAAFMRKIIITGGSHNELTRLSQIIDTDRTLNTIGNVSGGPATAVEVVIQDDIRKAVELADILIIAQNAKEFMGTVKDLKPGLVVCDVSAGWESASLSDTRKDITFIKAGLVKLPSAVDIPVNIGLPKNVVPAALAEIILLTFENKLIGRHASENTDIEKLEEIANIAVRHGFEVWVPEAPVR